MTEQQLDRRDFLKGWRLLIQSDETNQNNGGDA